ncbi:hypothetical protein Ac41p033 [Acinetobacter phage Ac42]|uniref:hypothetical protein n=1 Tax=Acinetobacter phage Ac42 TaxID=762660 RepID=UPI0001EBCC83|nr:hypothetical protein Ac41p033 [Acinetobacter phage Ac42]ADI96271.1 hypothetical protein Ac41p033 [Acinetobacter phage Ac42]
MYKIIARCIIAVIAIVVFGGSHYFYFFDKPKTYEQIIADGIVTEKYHQTYSCGKYDRYSCDEYILVFGDQNVPVAKSTFDRTIIGKDSKLIKTAQEDESIVWVFSMIIVWFTWFVIIVGGGAVAGVILFSTAFPKKE